MEQRLMKKLRCESCEKEGWNRAREALAGETKGTVLDAPKPPLKPDYEWESCNDPECRRCVGNVESFFRSKDNIEANPELEPSLPSQRLPYSFADMQLSQRINTVLQQYGLELVFYTENRFDSEEDSKWDESFMPTGFSKRKEGEQRSIYPTVDAYGGRDDYIGPTEVAPFPAELLQLPADADDRFARFVAETLESNKAATQLYLQS